MSVFMALNGGIVHAVDNTQGGVRNTLALAGYNGVNVSASVMDAGDVDRLGERYDFVVGKMVLHHIEPFREFAAKLRQCMNDGATGLFYENSSRNRILIFFRNHLVGRWGVPKYGDNVEIPLEDSEIDALRENFSEVSITIPKFVFFSMLGSYIFRKSKGLQSFFRRLDEFFYRRVKIFNRYSYHQVVMFRR